MVQNPGPLDPSDVVVRNENQTSNSRSVYLDLPYIQDRVRIARQGGRGGGREGEREEEDPICTYISTVEVDKHCLVSFT